jgi:phosphatidylinositol alpha 1,6-mannosyltransferase
MKIVFFSEVREPQVNGVVVTLARLARHLRARGHEILFVVPRVRGSVPAADIAELKAVPFPLYPEMRIVLPHWSFHKREFAQVEDFEPDLIHIWTPGVLAFFGQKWARANGCPVVASYETDMIRYLTYYGFGRFEPQAWRYFTWLHNNCQRTYVPSSDTRQFLESNGIQNVEVFSRGVDSIQFNPHKRSDDLRRRFQVDHESVLILYVGRMSKEKHLELLLESFMRIALRHPTAHLVMTGEGPIRGELTRKFAHPNITFTGVRKGEELASLFASADIFAIPSRTETLSLVSLEALASGVPVVAMRSGGVRDIVAHNQTGLLAHSDAEFENGLRRLIEDKPYRAALGRGARTYAEKKTWEHSFDDLENGYLALVRQGALS